MADDVGAVTFESVASSSSIIKSRSEPTKEALKLVVLETVVEAEAEAEDVVESTGVAEAEVVVAAVEADVDDTEGKTEDVEEDSVEVTGG